MLHPIVLSILPVYDTVKDLTSYRNFSYYLNYTYENEVLKTV